MGQAQCQRTAANTVRCNGLVVSDNPTSENQATERELLCGYVRQAARSLSERMFDRGAVDQNDCWVGLSRPAHADGKENKSMSRDELRKAFSRDHKKLSNVACSGCGAIITTNSRKDTRSFCVICLARALNSHFRQPHAGEARGAGSRAGAPMLRQRQRGTFSK